MDTSGNVNTQVKIPWITRPWNKDWIFWVFLLVWTAFSWQLMFSEGRTSSAAWLPAIIDLIFQMLAGFASTFALVAFPLLVVRRIYRGYVARKHFSNGEPAATYGKNQPRGWGVWLFVAASIIAIFFWIGGRDQNSLANILDGSGVDVSQDTLDFNERLESLDLESVDIDALKRTLDEQLESGTPDNDEVAQYLAEKLGEKPGYRVKRSYGEIQESLNNYFAVDPTKGDITVVFERLRGYMSELAGANAVMASSLDLVSSQSEMPPGSPDIKLLKDFSSALALWIDARVSYYEAQDACQLELSEEAFNRCQDSASDEWEPIMTQTIPPFQEAARRLSP